MSNFTIKSRIAILIVILLLAFASPALAVFGLFEKKSVNEQERIETMERIQDVQEKLKLLQDKLKALERRKAARAAAKDGVEPTTEAPGVANWQSVDESVIDPGDFGAYTYLLFLGNLEDTQAVGALEDLILTIETLPASDVPASLGNRFLIPVEQPQSTIKLGRQPYNFKLNQAYLQRFDLDFPNLGPVLVSCTEPVDPYGEDATPDFLAVNLGQQAPGQALALLKRWHMYETSLVDTDGHALGKLFLTLLNDAGPTRVEHKDRQLLIDLTR
jgi:hypothetical protein